MTTKNLLKFLPVLAVLIAVIVVWQSGVLGFVNLESIQAHRKDLLGYVTDKPFISILVFMGAYIACVALSLPIATLLTLLGGFLFGPWIGTLVIVTSATMGATILFLVAKTSFGEALRQKAGPLYDKVSNNMKDNAVGYMLFMRLVPLFPFFLVNIVPAIFNVRILPFVVTTFIGIIPGSFVYANFGRELGSINSVSDLASIQTVVAFSLLGFFALIPTIYKHFKKKKGMGDE